MERIILVSNIGSTSKKYSIYKENVEYAWFHFEQTGDEFHLSYKIEAHFEKKKITNETYAKALTFVKDSLNSQNVEIKYLAVRTVVPHVDFAQDKICSTEVLKELKQILHEDPLHIQTLILEIEEAQTFLDMNAIILVSDSSYHQTRNADIPLTFKEPLHSIGYHGLSCESVLDILNQHKVKHSKLIIAHLGGGSSITGSVNQKSVFNSMQFSPIGGMIMSSRSGSVDPFLILKYQKENNLSYEETIEHLYTKSGLLSLSGVSADLRVVREHALAGDVKSKKAIITFVDSIVEHILRASAHTQGIDTIVFTGTIGIRASYIRELVIEKLMWLGCFINHSRNSEVDSDCFEVSTFDSKIKIYVAQIDEMKQMHKHTQNFLKNNI